MSYCLLACGRHGRFLAGAAARGEESPEQAALKKATVGGKYTRLLAVIRVPGDRGDYGEFADSGHWDAGDWAGYKGLPAGRLGHTIFPHWYIWGKQGKGGDAVPIEKATVDGK